MSIAIAIILGIIILAVVNNIIVTKLLRQEINDLEYTSRNLMRKHELLLSHLHELYRVHNMSIATQRKAQDKTSGDE